MADQAGTAVARPRSVTMDMAERFGMEPAAFEATLRATVVPANCSREQFAAFLLVARVHGLNPLTKEIFAFPANGGIQPIVSIDGWMKLMNSHPEMDGLEFQDHIEEGKLVAVTARVYRKDRSRPVEVTEYLAECQRGTPTWKQWPSRMLRHKATIQAARYAFGFAGIMEPDEYERMVTVTEAVTINTDAPPPQTTQRRNASRLKKDGTYQRMCAEIRACRTTEELVLWRDDNAAEIAGLPKYEAGDWKEIIMDEWQARYDVLAAHEESPTETAGERASPTHPASPAASASEVMSPDPDARLSWPDIAKELALGPSNAMLAAQFIDDANLLDAITIITNAKWAKAKANVETATRLCEALENKRREAA